MKLAIPVWNDCVSTVLDFSACLLVVTFESGTISDRVMKDFTGNTTVEKLARLKELEIQILLCGAVSRPMEQMIAASGIKIIPFLRGRVDDAIEAYFSGRLFEPCFILPGCRRGPGFGRGGGQRIRGRKCITNRKEWFI